MHQLVLMNPKMDWTFLRLHVNCVPLSTHNGQSENFTPESGNLVILFRKFDATEL